MAAGTAPRLKRLLTKAGRPCALREPEMDCEGPNRASPGRQAAARPGEAQSWQASAPSAEGSCGGASARRGHIRHGRIRLVSVRGRESSQAGAPGQAEDVTARLTSPGCWKLGAVTVRFRDDDGPSPRSRGELCCSAVGRKARGERGHRVLVFPRTATWIGSFSGIKAGPACSGFGHLAHGMDALLYNSPVAGRASPDAHCQRGSPRLWRSGMLCLITSWNR
ncbi:uncharacterized protein LOC124418251 isoform X2 [Gallus gallus]|uniref:uncharacterized protein LOC124418251 isoform X2 n=1 Tax=Gallus gallus TaxID=9031 RepID=UPI001EFF738D|nr:uncharacterized protein LOC124418251 isoform X2 [Gallus gallus]